MGKRSWFRALFGRRLLIALLIVLQAAFLIYVIASGSALSRGLSGLLTLLSILAVLSIVSRRGTGSAKTLWVFLILSFPIFGGLLYLMVNFQGPTRRMQRALRQAQEKTAPLYPLSGDCYDRAKAQMPVHFPQVRYLRDHARFPIYDGTKTTYFPLGEAMLEALLTQLEKAQHYIFLEYFIIQEGQMWDSILHLLRRKAAEGVKVRVMYDDLGCFFGIHREYEKQLRQMGIECTAFNPFKPFLTVKQNNRDHRKIAVIDGKVAFTGGINLADEYINACQKYGHWKDTAVMLQGKAAWSMALMFLELWQVCTGCQEDPAVYRPSFEDQDDGFVLPYCDSPMDSENVGEQVYLQILGEAKDYVYINTPYLIIDDSMVSALCLAAKRGVDVRIVTPYRGDNPLVHMATRSYYRELIRSGVRVYEYARGFIHAKSFVSDDCIATVGTANLDFRSLYLHFECGVWFWKSSVVTEARDDFLNTLSLCRPIEEADCKARPLTRLLQDILRLFAPLL